MNKKRLLISIILMILFVSLSSCASLFTHRAPEESLKKAFPKVTYSSIEESEIKGLYEVTAGNNIIYYYPEKDYLFFGEIWSSNGVNITSQKRLSLITKTINSLPFDRAIKIGRGPIKVVEFVDPDCLYSR